MIVSTLASTQYFILLNALHINYAVLPNKFAIYTNPHIQKIGVKLSCQVRQCG